jgi:hypothetical protein
MQVGQPWPVQHEQSAEHHEQHEGEVDADDEVGKEFVWQFTYPPTRLPAAHRTAYTGGRCSAAVCQESP